MCGNRNNRGNLEKKEPLQHYAERLLLSVKAERFIKHVVLLYIFSYNKQKITYQPSHLYD